MIPLYALKVMLGIENTPLENRVHHFHNWMNTVDVIYAVQPKLFQSSLVSMPHIQTIISQNITAPLSHYRW